VDTPDGFVSLESIHSQHYEALIVQADTEIRAKSVATAAPPVAKTA
jgi:hypothetical protein